MGDNTHEQAEAVGGVLRRINQLGAATERLFSRLFINMNQRAKIESEREARLRRKAELEAKINRARLAVAQNRQLKARIQVQQRDIERLDGM